MYFVKVSGPEESVLNFAWYETTVIFPATWKIKYDTMTMTDDVMLPNIVVVDHQF